MQEWENENMIERETILCVVNVFILRETYQTHTHTRM